MTTLDRLELGKSGRLIRLEGERALCRRLMELGLLPGCIVRLIRRAKLGGVLELEVRSCRLTIRSSEANLLFVEPS